MNPIDGPSLGRPDPLDDGSAFSHWAHRWIELGEYQGTDVPDVEGRINKLIALWNEPVPPIWERVPGGDKRLLNPAERYCRGNRGPDGTRTGEHVVEYEILAPDPDDLPTVCFGARLVDGVNAIPLVTDMRGKRAGNVEADMLLLARRDDDWRLFLVEVKTGSNNAWYAAVENLRQMALFSKSDATKGLFRSRQPDLRLPESIPATAVVLAELGYYKAAGAKSAAVAPAQRLLQRIRKEVGVDAALATWDPAKRVIAPLTVS